MSLFPSTTKGGEQWQHCNYGYDRSKYNSMEDCMKDIDPSTKDELTDYGKQLQQQTSDEAKNLKDISLRSCEDILNDNTRSPYRLEKYNKCLEKKQQNIPFYKKHSDTIRTIVIIGVAYYIWKSGMINKILK